MPVKIARSAPRPSFGLPELLVAIHTSPSVLLQGRKNANIYASSGVIRGIPVNVINARAQQDDLWSAIYLAFLVRDRPAAPRRAGSGAVHRRLHGAARVYELVLRLHGY